MILIKTIKTSYNIKDEDIRKIIKDEDLINFLVSRKNFDSIKF